MKINKKIAIGAGIGLVTVLGAVGGSVYYGKTNLERRLSVVDSNLQKMNIGTQKNEHIKFQKTVINEGLFESSGQYTISYQDPKDKEFNSTLVIEYLAEHGISTWFGENINFSANAKISGNLVKTIQLKTKDGVLAKFNGIVTDDGSLEIDNTSDEISFVIPKSQQEESVAAVNEPTVVESEVKPESTPEAPKEETKVASTDNKSGSGLSVKFGSYSGKYSISSSGNGKSLVKYSEVVAEDIEDPTDKIVLKGLSAGYDFNVNNLNVGKLNLGVDSFVNGTDTVKAEGVKLLVSVDNKNKKYDFVLDSKIKSLTAFGQQNALIEFGYSIKGIDERMMNLYKKFTTIYASGKEFEPKDIEEAKKVVNESLKTGFSFSIDKVKFENEKNKIDISGQYEIKPTEKDTDFSFANQTKFGAKISITGELAQTANMMLGNTLGLNEPPKELPASETQGLDKKAETIPEAIVEPAKDFNLSFSYENKVLLINDQPAKSEISLSINDSFSKLDSQLGFTKVEEVTAPVPTETEKPSEEAKK